MVFNWNSLFIKIDLPLKVTFPLKDTSLPTDKRELRDKSPSIYAWFNTCKFEFKETSPAT